MSRAATAAQPPRDPDDRDLRDQAKALGLHGLAGAWDQYRSSKWVKELVDLEQEERSRRRLARRLRNAQLSNFKSLADFDWGWPKKVDRDQVEELMQLPSSRTALTSCWSDPTASARP